MDRFEGATTVRLKGAHGKYLWAEHDQYGVSQEEEDKNEQALWRVERARTGSKPRTLRLKSCFDTYLTASESHYHGFAFLSFAGKRVTQMRPENVESATAFDWEPVMDRGVLKLKSCYGTYLRANSKPPPWNDSVSHDLPQHQSHLDWLGWEVQKVRVPHVVPLELVIGRLSSSENEQRSLDERSKIPGETTATSRANEPRQGRRVNNNPDAAPTTRTGDEWERHSVPSSSRNPGAGRAHQSEQQERSRNPGADAGRRSDEAERRPMPGRPKAPDEATARRASEVERHTVQGRSHVGTSRSVEEEAHRHPPAQERARNSGVRPSRRV